MTTPKNTTPSPSGLPRVPISVRIDPKIKTWLEAQGINPAILLEEAAAKLKRERSAGKGFGKSKK